ncbi:hypothetical protein BC827DRAFT_1387625 [Russula dissimulans]|nr:hypothetical protein BC827DRAFT_1387625 [Russula dissimulans]
MQLRTILISTGILALATSLTLGGPTPVILATGPGKRTNVDRRDPVPLQLILLQNTDGAILEEGDSISVVGFEGSASGPPIDVADITGEIYMYCSVPIYGNMWFDPSNNYLDDNKLSIAHVTVGEQDWTYTMPEINPGANLIPPGHYPCVFEMAVDSGGEHHGPCLPPASAYVIWSRLHRVQRAL